MSGRAMPAALPQLSGRKCRLGVERRCAGVSGDALYKVLTKSSSEATPVPSSPPASLTAAHPLIACFHCDLLQAMAPIPANTQAICRRCGSTLYADRGATIQRTLALYLAALLLFALANVYPFLTLSMQGLSQSGHLMSSPIALWHAGMPEVAAVIAFFVVIAPADSNRRGAVCPRAACRRHPPAVAGARDAHHARDEGMGDARGLCARRPRFLRQARRPRLRPLRRLVLRLRADDGGADLGASGVRAARRLGPGDADAGTPGAEPGRAPPSCRLPRLRPRRRCRRRTRRPIAGAAALRCTGASPTA